MVGAKADGEGADVGDKIELRSLSEGFSAELYVSAAAGYDPFGASAPSTTIRDLEASWSGFSLSATEWLTNDGAISVLGDLRTQGGRVTLIADKVSVGTSTQATTVNTSAGTIAGDIRIGSRTTTVEDKSSLIATGSGASGSISIDAQEREVFLVSQFASTKRSSSITLTGAILKAGDVSLTANAVNSTAEGEDLGLPGAIGGLAASEAPKFVSELQGLGGISASVVMRETAATIRLTDTTIDSSGSVTLQATTKTGTKPLAIAAPVGKEGKEIAGKTYTAGDGQFINGIQFAAAAGTARSSVQTSLEGASRITAAGDVQIGATGEVAIKGAAKASAKGTQQGTAAQENVTDDNNATSVALLVTLLDYDASVSTGAATSVVSKTGNVNFLAKGTTEHEAKAAISGDRDVNNAVALSVLIDKTKINTTINGDVSAGASTTGSSGENKFVDAESKTAVDVKSDTIELKNHGFTNGQKLLYTVGVDPVLRLSAAEKQAIGGLTDGTWYYAKVIDDNHFQLTTAAPIDIAAEGLDKNSVQSLSTTDARLASLNVVEAKTATRPSVIRADQGHSFIDGEKVRYEAGTATLAISGLTNGETYTVSVIDDLRFALKTSAGDFVVMQDGSLLGDHSFTSIRNSNLSIPSLATAIDLKAKAIVAAGHPFETGDTLTYTVDTNGTAIGGLTPDSDYVVVRVSDSAFKLRSASGTEIELSSLGSGSHTFTLRPKSLTLTAMSLDAATNTIALKDHGFSETTPPTVFYSLLNSTDDALIGGLKVGGSYKVQVVDADHFKLLNVADAKEVDITTAKVGGQHQFAFLASTKTFKPATAVDASKDQIAIADHGFKSGDQVIYRVDPAITRTISQDSGTVKRHV